MRPKVSKLEDFIKTLCIGPTKGIASRVVKRANEIIDQQKSKSLLSKELLFVSAKLEGLGYLIENQMDSASPSCDECWGIALILSLEAIRRL